eukprot:CAMPEP_0115289624 /NCGR_PEP_ID=MMETSP0270-20121206/63609_1 /TAXON_ID=71861 /ORGANISM="Scrippsiella trochoidea, Strain CCMP3099" /LENGTH=264 /DNA_ID=CAMNT_0002706817 /DNA_START=78 /DNA_END=872 /DNA_ORIENTATION=-
MASGRVATQAITQQDANATMRRAIHTQHHGSSDVDGAEGGATKTVVTTVKKHALVPVEETVKVPVVRKEVKRYKEKQVVKAQRLVPVQKFKEVTETTMEVRREMVNGRPEKRAVPVTKTRMQPYTDYVEEEYDVVVQVPKEEVVTRTGYRMDKHVTSKLMEIEEDHVYELRPVLVEKTGFRQKELCDHHVFKKEHGLPVWDDDAKNGWLGKPKTPLYKSHLHRPNSAASLGGVTMVSAVGRPRSGRGMQRSASHGTLQRPRTGM